MNLIVNEIFHSLQGETTTAGYPSLFIRLAGCNLKCSYCDTVYARSSSSGREMAIEDILIKAELYKNQINHITITGGEPLLQPCSILLMKQLINKGHNVQIETNGSISVEEVPEKVRKIIDVKTPSSGEAKSFLITNLKYITKTDELKFVILDMKDYNFSVEFIKKNLKDKDIVINFSPVSEKLSASTLTGWILNDRIPVRLNLQLHKVIWPDGEPKTEQE
jgi:7-carboxy-7-deazaguanine synthase